MQALTDSAEAYQGGHLSKAARELLAHLETDQGQDFGFFEHQSHSPTSRKFRNELSITVPRNPTGKKIVASPNSANTPPTPPSPEDEPNITVEPLAPAEQNVLRQTHPAALQQPQYALANALHQNQPPYATGPHVRPALLNAGLPKKKKSHARKQPVGHIPRPRNAFILFRKQITDNNLIPKSVEVKHQNISIVASKMWAEAPAEVKSQFTEAAKREKEEHARLYPNYRYQPAYRRTDIIRRRVRKDPLEDDKCDAVASLLIQGKAGNALENEVKEKIAEKTGLVENPEDINLVVKRGRRKRKDAPGELSKGAIRAEKAAERARAMREHWIDTSMLLAQQANDHAHQRMPSVQYYEDRYQQPNVVYVDEFGRPMYEERYEVQYGNRHEQGDYYHPVDAYGHGAPMGHIQAQDQYHGASMRLPRVDEQLPFQMQAPMRMEQPMMEQPHMFEGQHVMPDQVMQYPQQAEVDHQWRPNRALLPFEQHAVHAPGHDNGPAQMQHVMEQEPGNYALDPLLAAPANYSVDAYGQVPQEDSNNHAADEYRTLTMPSDIIAGRWARDQNATHDDDETQRETGNDEQADQQQNINSLLPLMEGEQTLLPSHHIDFGEKGELFGGDLNEVFPGDPDIEDYNAALHHQQDMEGLMGQW